MHRKFRRIKPLKIILKRAYYILKPNKYFCLVVGNRQVKQERLPTDFIIAELSQAIGFRRYNSKKYSQ